MILDLLSGAVKVVSKAIGGSTAEKLKNAVEEIQNRASTSPETKMALLDHEVEITKLMVADANAGRAFAAEELKSEDAFVRRARPSFLWLGLVVLFCNLIVFPILVGSGLMKPLVYPELPSQAYWLIGSIFGMYAGARSLDKRGTLKKIKEQLPF